MNRKNNTLQSRTRLIALLLFFIAFAPAVKSQIDTLFWFAAPWVTPDHDGNRPMAFRISAFSNPTTVRVRQPAATFDTTFTIPANSLFSKSLTHIVSSLESKPADQVLNTGFQITSDYPITVVYDFISDTITGATGNNPETYSLKGQNGMGTEFVTPFQNLWYNRTLGGDVNGDGTITQPYSFFSICATEDSTVVYITPRCNIVGGHPAGVTFSVTLDKGQVYTAQNVTQAANVSGQNLSGSIVVSNKPVTITVNDDSVQPGGVAGCTCYDLMGDQIVPTDVIGNEYIVNKGFLNSCAFEAVFFVAVQNFTTVTVTDGVVTQTFLMNQGDTKVFNITQNLTHLISDKPIYVIHMSGYGCELGEAILPPINCSGSDQVSFSRNNGQSFLLNILCRNGVQGNFILDGSAALVPAASFTVVPGTGGAWVGAQISYTTAQLPANAAHFIQNTADNFSLGIINGGATSGCLYHYMSSFIRRVYTNAGIDQVVCTSNNQINLNGSVTGGAITGMWSVLNGTGTFADDSSLVTTYTPSSSDTAQGSVTIVLTSTGGNCNPVMDTMVVNFEKSPIVYAGGDATFCKNNLGTINLSGSLAYAVGASWSGGNGGAFGNSGSLNTTYTPSPADLAADSIYLTLTSAGSFFGCPNTSDSVKLVFTDPPVVNAGAATTVCANNPMVTLSGVISGASSTGIWTTNGSGAFSPSDTNMTSTYMPSPTDTSLGSIVITLTSTNNGICNAVQDSITVTIIDAPVVNITSTDTVCANVGTINLTSVVSSGFGVQWSTSGNGSFANSTAQNTIYTLSPLDTMAGTIDLVLSTVPGLCNAETDTLHLVMAAPPVVNAGTNQSFCANQAIQLNGVVSGVTTSGVWSSTGTGTFNPDDSLLTTQYTASALDISAGSVSLILTSTNNGGCNAAKDTLTVTFMSPPSAAFMVNAVCFGNSNNFTDASTTGTGTINSWSWNFGDFTSSIAQNPIHTYPAPGTYTATLVAGSSNGCYDTVQNVVTVYELPVADFSFTNPCAGSAVGFNDLSFIGTGSITGWNYAFGDTSANATIQNPTHVYSNTGTYPVTLQVTSNNNCVNSVTYNVTVLPSPIANFVMSANPVVALENVNFTDQSYGNPVGWIWNFGDTTGTNQQNPSHSYGAGGTYTITLVVIDGNGCMDTTQHEILVALLPVLPTAFTPGNSDGHNDIFYVRGGPFKNLVFKVYNNWGELLFETTDQTQGWDGTYKGVEQPMGTYVWTVDVEITESRTLRTSGDVTLIR